jgi:WD40 repeat protein
MASNQRLAAFRAYDVSGVHSMVLNPATGALVTGGDGSMSPRMPEPGKPLVLDGAQQDDPETLVRVWSPRTADRTGVYSGPGIKVEDLAFSPDGRYIAATKGRWIGRKSSYVLVWNSPDGKLIAALDCGQAMLEGIEFSPDGRKLAYAADSTIHVIELDNNLFAQ